MAQKKEIAEGHLILFCRNENFISFLRSFITQELRYCPLETSSRTLMQPQRNEMVTVLSFPYKVTALMFTNKMFHNIF